MRDLGVSDRLARQWLKQHGEAYVSEKIGYVESQSDVANPVSYLSSALKRDFKRDADRSELKDMSTDTALRDRAARLVRIRDIAAARTPTQRDADRRYFLSLLGDRTLAEDFERHGWMSALNHQAIVSFWRELQPDAFTDLSPSGLVASQ